MQRAVCAPPAFDLVLKNHRSRRRHRMRFTLLVLSLLVVACSSDDRAYPTTRVAAAALCVPMCEWADECHALETTVEDCVDGCTAGICNRAGVNCAAAPVVDDEAIDQCVTDAEQHTGCTVDTPPSCDAPFGN
jgi:hypothetical protein